MDFFIVIRQPHGSYCVYESDKYKIGEDEFLKLIKVCVIQGRSVTTGRKFIDIFRDAVGVEGEKKLNAIGVKNNQPTKLKKGGTKIK